MQQFVFISASVYNNSLNTHSVTKQELPKCQPLQDSTCQIDSFKEEINIRLFAKADKTLVDKI